MTPDRIETESFAIIEREAGAHGFGPLEWPIVRRMIHTSADFEYLHSVRFHPRAIEAGIRAIRAAKPIVTDTGMCRAGIRQSLLDPFGGRVHCLMAEPETATIAAGQGITRAAVAVERAASLMADGIYVVGNAPTALLRLLELMQAGTARPALVIGLPVGFVNAAESKAALLAAGTCPCITNVGRKGGSNLAASVVNALAILAGQGAQHKGAQS